MPAQTTDTTPSPAEAQATALPLAFGNAVFRVWTDMGQEMIRFLWDRLQQDMQTQQAMLACTSLEEMRDIQARFFVAAQQDYGAMAGRMLGLLGSASVMGLPPMGAKRRYDDVPL